VTWRLTIHHCSGYRYASEVRSSYNEARISPLTTPDQLVISATVDVTPQAHVVRYWDYWATLVHAFDVHEPHTELVVDGRSLVQTERSPAEAPTLDWASLRDDAVIDDFADLLAPTSYVHADDEIRSVASELASCPSPRDAVDGALDWVGSTLRYAPGATGVHTSAVEARRGGLGVCQDYAHLTLAVLREAGIPARYASGYLYPSADGEIGDEVTGESHAWIEIWTGGWWGVDPAGGEPIGERHVLVARGRDYADVPPLKGIYHGGPSESLGVTVTLCRVA
jgi:transglutaminase-like putative cysteine protease